MKAPTPAEPVARPKKPLPRPPNSVLALQRLAGNAAVSRLMTDDATVSAESATGGGGALSALGALSTATPSGYTTSLATAAGAVTGALVGEQRSGSLTAAPAPTGVSPGGPVEMQAPPTVTAEKVQPIPRGGDVDPSVADQHALGATAAVRAAADQTATPAPHLGSAINPMIEPVTLPAAELAAAGPVGATPAALVPRGERESAAFDATAGAEVSRLVGRLLQPASAAESAHVAEVARSHQSSDTELAGLQGSTQARQQAVRETADEDIAREEATWTASRQQIVTKHQSSIEAAAAQTKSEMTEAVRRAESDAKDGGDNRQNSAGGLWDRIKSGASSAVGAVKGAAAAVGSGIAGVVAAVRGRLQGLVTGLVDAVGQRVSAAITAIRAGAARAWGAMRAAVDRAQQTITALARAAIATARRIRARIAAAVAATWQRLVDAAKSAFAKAADVGRRLAGALGKVREVLKLLDSPLLTFLVDAARDTKKVIIDPLIAKAAPYIGKVPDMAKDVLAQQGASPTTEPKIPLQRQVTTDEDQEAGSFSDAVDHEMHDDVGRLRSNWMQLLSDTMWNVLWPVYLFTEEGPALVEEAKGIFHPAPGLDWLDHFLGVVRRLVNLINGTLATLGVWAGLLALAGGPVAEFFTVGAYYAVSLVMIQVDIGVAIAQLLKYWYSGSRPNVTPQAQAKYARLYSSTSVSAILTAALVVLGIVASRFGARFRKSLPAERVEVDPKANKPPVPDEKPPVPEEKPPVPAEPRRFGLPSEGYAAGSVFNEFITHGVPSEGWKLHVSADASSASAVADALLPKLRSMGVNHKVVNSVETLQRMSTGQQAKFVTIYPDNTTHAKQLVATADAAVSGVGGGAPAVAGELPVGSSGRVYTRYGGFTKLTVTDPSTGAEVRDVRGQVAPPWVDNPWTGQPAPVPAPPPKQGGEK